MSIKSNKTDGEFLRIECFGVKLEIEAGSGEIRRFIEERLDEVFPDRWRMAEHFADEFEHRFSLSEGSGIFEVSRDGSQIAAAELQGAFGILESQLRLTVAEFTTEAVFLHAGVVGWNGYAVIIPGTSFSGKTTLVAELVRRGCLYLSDEYAVITRDGMVHPFAKKLSVRGIVNDFTQIELDVNHFGGKKSSEPLPAGFLLATRYRHNADDPIDSLAEASTGIGVMAALANSISIRRQPRLVIESVEAALSGCRIFQGERGEVDAFADLFIETMKKDGRGQSGCR